ncbi:MAG TPA: hypothetical protein VMU87_11445 [Stellaceae bacterium]|nr:hypothetical protein [Stellaceae bacterium]
MSPRFLWLSVLPILALQPALSRAADPSMPFVVTPMEQRLREAGDLARQATDALLHSFEQLRRAIPDYGTPYVDESGNIVIPRRHSPAAPRGTPMPSRRQSSA